MPELPEVEANRTNLERWALGQSFVSIVPPRGTRETGGMAPARFRRLLHNAVPVRVLRRGKWILIAFRTGGGLGLHLGMTGKIAFTRPGELTPRFSRAAFALEDGGTVHFLDSRRFGKLRAVDHFDTLLNLPEISSVGPDALNELTFSQFREALAGSRRAVKVVLLDQKLMAGIGNIYATEALWKARIHPATPALTVAARLKECRALFQAIRASLEYGITVYNGESLPEYLEAGGPNPFSIYDRAGQPCPRCRTPLEKRAIGGRTSAFCHRCQPLLTN